MTEQARRFTVEEANALLSELAPRLERIRGLRSELVQTADEISQRASHNGGASTPARSAAAETELREELEAVALMGIVFRDAETGLIDFPGERDGEPVFLCWRLGEDAVRFWHPPDTGFGSRRPL